MWLIQFTTDRGVHSVYVTADNGQTAIEKAKAELSNFVKPEYLIGCTRLASFVSVFRGQDLRDRKHEYHSYKLA